MAEFEDYTTDDFQGDSASQQSTPAMAYGTSPHSNVSGIKCNIYCNSLSTDTIRKES